MKKGKSKTKEASRITQKRTKSTTINRHANQREPNLWKEIRVQLQPLSKAYNKFREKRKISKQKAERRGLKEQEELKLREEEAQRLMEQEERKLKKEKRLKAQEERKLKKEKRLKEKNQFGKNIAIIFSFAAQFIIGFIIAVFIVLIIIYAIF